MTPQERIKADAEKAFPMRDTFHNIQRLGYIAGATAVHDRAQVLVDFIQEIIDFPPAQSKSAMSEWIDKYRYEACSLLQKWKGGKEVESPCPNCGKELSKDRHGCCRECGAFEFNTNPQK